jgi:hypothetical protein
VAPGDEVGDLRHRADPVANENPHQQAGVVPLKNKESNLDGLAHLERVCCRDGIPCVSLLQLRTTRVGGELIYTRAKKI